MITVIKGYLGGKYKGTFKNDKGEDIAYNKILILPEQDNAEYLMCSADTKINLEGLTRFGLYNFNCDLKGDKIKVNSITVVK